MTLPSDNTLGLPSGTILKDYKIQKILGKGGFAITYLATDLQLHKQVVLKELLPDGIATRIHGNTVVTQTPGQQDDFRWAVDSFLKEARTLANFEHPNIVRVSRLFEANGTAYIVMPFIEGQTLKEIITRSSPMSYQTVCDIIAPLLNGLSSVHQSGILHRDIKPDNIFVTSDHTPVLIDFGASRQQVSGKSMDVTSIITPGYAPIEQYSTDSRYQGPWSDIYALGAVAYHMITGIKPQAASERNDAIRNGQIDPLKPLLSISPQGYPQSFQEAIDAALQMGETQRPQNVLQWQNRLAITSPSERNATPAPSRHTPAPHPTGTSGKKAGMGAVIKSLIIVACLLILCGLAGFAYFVISKNQKNNRSTATITQPLIGTTAKKNQPTLKATRKITIQPDVRFENSRLGSDGLQLIQKYLTPLHGGDTWEFEIESNSIVITMPEDTPLPVTGRLEIPHMQGISVVLNDGGQPKFELMLQSREVMVFASSSVSQLEYEQDLSSVKDAQLSEVLRSHSKPNKLRRKDLNNTVHVWRLPEISGVIKVNSPGLRWEKPIDSSITSMVLGKNDPTRITPSASIIQRLERAERGEMKAQFELGEAYHYGNDVDQNSNLSFGWFLLAANQGHSSAQHNVGLAYETENGTGLDMKAAISWYNKAAAQNHAPSKMAIATFHELGLGGFQKNLAEAKIWYAKSIEQEYAPAMHNLAGLHWAEADALNPENEPEITALRNQAISLYNRASRLDHAPAIHNLAQIHLHGLMGEKDITKAIKMLKAAAQKGFKESKNQLRLLADGGNDHAKRALAEVP